MTTTSSHGKRQPTHRPSQGVLIMTTTSSHGKRQPTHRPSQGVLIMTTTSSHGKRQPSQPLMTGFSKLVFFSTDV